MIYVINGVVASAEDMKIFWADWARGLVNITFLRIGDPYINILTD